MDSPPGTRRWLPPQAWWAWLPGTHFVLSSWRASWGGPSRFLILVKYCSLKNWRWCYWQDLCMSSCCNMSHIMFHEGRTCTRSAVHLGPVLHRCLSPGWLTYTAGLASLDGRGLAGGRARPQGRQLPHCLVASLGRDVVVHGGLAVSFTFLHGATRTQWWVTLTSLWPILTFLVTKLHSF